MRRLSWIITIPVAVVAVVFAIANRESVRIDLWPLEPESVPLFLVVLGALLIGFLAGAAVMWLASGRTRERARLARFQVEDLERELNYMKRKQAHRAAGPPAVPTSGRSDLPAASAGG